MLSRTLYTLLFLSISLCSQANNAEREKSLSLLKVCAAVALQSNNAASFEAVSEACTSELQAVFTAHSPMSQEYVLSQLLDDFEQLKTPR